MSEEEDGCDGTIVAKKLPWRFESKESINVYTQLHCLAYCYTVVSCKYAPPFATLASVQNTGGACTRDATISLAITPPLPVPIQHDLIVGGDEGQA